MSTLIDDYKNAMSHMAQSVSILTHQKAGARIGVTVTSASSYSAEPPIFMAAIHRESTLAERLSLGDALTMNLLSQSHDALADRFSGRTGIQGEARFDEGDWRFDAAHAPRLKDALASFSGTLRALIPQASHAILLVEISEIAYRQGAPLVYHDRAYKPI